MGRVPPPKPSGNYQKQKYPTTGANYDRYGEQSQNGWIYIPYEDKYVPDPKKQQEYAYSSGLAERPKEPPGLFESLAPVAGVGAALYGGKWLGEEGLSKVGDKIAGIFEGGGAATEAATNTGSGLAGSFGGGAAPGGMAAPGGGALAPGGEAATGMFDLGGIGSSGNVILPAVGAYGAYDVLTGDYGTGRNALQGAASGAAMGSYFGPQGALIGGGIGLGAGLIKGMFDHESTRDVAKKHTSGLLEQGKDNPAWQSYVSGMREQHNQAAPDPSKPFHGGQYGSWDEYKAAGLDAADLTGVYGNLKAYGPKWASLTQEQRQAITQENINSGLYNSKKGEVEISDSAKAQENYNKIVNAQPAAPTARPTPRPAPQPSKSTQRRKGK